MTHVWGSDDDTIDGFYRQQGEEAAAEMDKIRKEADAKYIENNNLREKAAELGETLNTSRSGWKRSRAYRQLRSIKKRFKYHGVIPGPASNSMMLYEGEPMQKFKRGTKKVIKWGLVGLILWGTATKIKSCYNNLLEESGISYNQSSNQNS